MLGLSDNHEIYTSGLISNRGGTSVNSGLSTNILSNYAQYHPNTPSILINPNLLNSDPYVNYLLNACKLAIKT